MYNICFTHSPINGHFSGLQVLTIVNYAIMKVGVQTSFESLLSLLWGIHPEVGSTLFYIPTENT